MLLIKFMQTAQLNFNGRIITKFFAVLFLFQCCEKDRNPLKYPRSVICWDFFSLFFGHFGVKNGRYSRSAFYRFPRSIGLRYNGTAVYFSCINIRKYLVTLHKNCLTVSAVLV